MPKNRSKDHQSPVADSGLLRDCCLFTVGVVLIRLSSGEGCLLVSLPWMLQQDLFHLSPGGGKCFLFSIAYKMSSSLFHCVTKVTRAGTCALWPNSIHSTPRHLRLMAAMKTEDPSRLQQWSTLWPDLQKKEVLGNASLSQGAPWMRPAIFLRKYCCDWPSFGKSTQIPTARHVKCFFVGCPSHPFLV